MNDRIEPILLRGGPARGKTYAVHVGAAELILPGPMRPDGYFGEIRYARTADRSAVGRPVFEYQEPSS